MDEATLWEGVVYTKTTDVDHPTGAGMRSDVAGECQPVGTVATTGYKQHETRTSNAMEMNVFLCSNETQTVATELSVRITTDFHR